MHLLEKDNDFVLLKGVSYGTQYIHLCFGLFREALKLPVTLQGEAMLSMPQCLKVDVSQQAVQKFFLVDLECSAQSPTAHFIGSVFLTSVR